MTHATLHKALPKVNTAFEQQPFHFKATTASHAATASSGGSILRTIVGLVIVIAVIYGLTWIVRKLKTKDAPAAGDGLERIASLPLGANKSVALVRVGSELHLLGVGDHSVTGIRSFSEDEAVELGLPVTPPGSLMSGRGDGESAGFTGALRAVASGDALIGAVESLRRRTQR